MSEPIDSPTAPEPVRSGSYTHKLLQKYYSTVSTLRDLLPPERGGDDDGFDDSESFRRLVRGTVVASRAPAGPPRLDAASMGQGANGASMPEVSLPLVEPTPPPAYFLSNTCRLTPPSPFCRSSSRYSSACLQRTQRSTTARGKPATSRSRLRKTCSRSGTDSCVPLLSCSLSMRCPSCSLFASIDSP